jgi:hypothetical protein
MNRFADPLPVSGRPAQPPPQEAVGNTGRIYGTQARMVWDPGQIDPRVVCDSIKALSLWRFSAFGRVTVTIGYGTQGTREISSLRTPLVLTIPGQFTATATPIDSLGTICTVTLTPATAGTRSIARRFVTTTLAATLSAQLEQATEPGNEDRHHHVHPVNLDDDAAYFYALTPASLTIAGIPVYATPFQTLPLVAGSILMSGAGFQEFEA